MREPSPAELARVAAGWTEVRAARMLCLAVATYRRKERWEGFAYHHALLLAELFDCPLETFCGPPRTARAGRDTRRGSGRRAP